MPVDIVLPNKRVEKESKSRVFYTTYVSEWKKRMEEAYHVPSQNISNSAKRGKSNYDSKGYSIAVLNVKDHVLVRNLLEKGGPGKLRPYWEQDTYVVVDRPLKNLSVYDFRKLNGTGRVRRLHRSLLLLCNNLPVPNSSQETRRKPARRYRKQKPRVIQESSDSSSEWMLSSLPL